MTEVLKTAENIALLQQAAGLTEGRVSLGDRGRRLDLYRFAERVLGNGGCLAAIGLCDECKNLNLEPPMCERLGQVAIKAVEQRAIQVANLTQGLRREKAPYFVRFLGYNGSDE